MAMQNITDMLTETNEFDKFVDQQSGKININQICEILSMSVWSLLMAKARASFSMTDIVDSSQRKKKYNQIFYISIMIAIAQILKSCAENNYVENFVEKAEETIDHNIFNKTIHHHGPIVKSAHNTASIDEVLDERQKQASNIMADIDDLNIYKKFAKESSFDPKLIEQKLNK